MDERIKALVSQIRILETEANKHTGSQRAELFRAAGRIKDQVATLLNQQGKGQQQQGAGIPSPDEYFGDNLTQQQRDYFNNLTPEMEQYFATPKIQNFDNAPSAPKQPAPAETKQKDDDEAELRRRIYAALGIFY
ncbi:hypothetical protein ABEM11_22615 [Escherichia coli]